jgi:hypothetical protein
MLLLGSRPLLSLILISSLAVSARAGDPTSLATQMLAIHNHERGLVGTPPLRWNDGLAADAQAYVGHLVEAGALEHSSDESRGDEGENLAMGTAGYYSPAALGRMWADEKRAFVNGPFGDGSGSGGWEDVGHYTQMVWRDTRQVGCAVGSGGGDTYLICRYAPAGNYIGERVY